MASAPTPSAATQPSPATAGHLDGTRNICVRPGHCHRVDPKFDRKSLYCEHYPSMSYRAYGTAIDETLARLGSDVAYSRETNRAHCIVDAELFYCTKSTAPAR